MLTFTAYIATVGQCYAIRGQNISWSVPSWPVLLGIFMLVLVSNRAHGVGKGVKCIITHIDGPISLT